VRLGVVEGTFHWHRHDGEDEFFFVLEGELTVEVAGGPSVTLGPLQGYTVPRGVEHRTRAPSRTVMLMSSAAGVVPTGDGDGDGGDGIDAYRRLVALLDAGGADYRVVEHPAEGRTDVVSGLRGHPLGAAAKCMVTMVKLDKKRRRFVVAVVPGDRRIDLDALRRHYGGRYAGMADTADAERLSGCAVGTILPFTWDDDLDLVVDPALYEHEVIWFNAGRLDRSVAVRSADHRRIAAPTEAAVAAPPLPPSAG
jgi:Ala-tRNA(Pro) deacylase